MDAYVLGFEFVLENGKLWLKMTQILAFIMFELAWYGKLALNQVQVELAYSQT